MLRFYNTLGRRIEEFREIEPGTVGLYTCGPTVYDFPHIGNFRSYVFEDLVKRYLLYLGFKVRHVMNITDIDDKIIRKAQAQGTGIDAVSAPYVEAFFADRDRLKVLPADVYPKATAHIPEMIEIIGALLAKGLAYEKDGSVYFSIARFPAYGRLAGLDKENLKAGARIDSDEYEKEEVQDFALWKGRREGEPSWPAPFGEGRPGWHIECSAMSQKYLGPTFDIHMGGVDNIFPHHENEIAQSEGANGVAFVRYWLHAQHLIVDNQKMSKSLGNFYTLGDLLGRGFDPLAVRYLLISTHYRKLLNFTLEGLEAAAAALARLRNFVSSLRETRPAAGATAAAAALGEKTEAEFRSCLDDDFNVSGALGALFDFIREGNAMLPQLKSEDVAGFLSLLDRVNSVLGVLETQAGPELLDEEIQAQIARRQQARRDRDFRLADRIRDELKARGITLMDTPDGVKWRR